MRGRGSSGPSFTATARTATTCATKCWEATSTAITACAIICTAIARIIPRTSWGRSPCFSGLNRGNRALKLNSVASKAEGLTDFSYTDKNPDPALRGARFAQGDIVQTVITCAGGETISLRLDTTLPRFYSREFTVRGTKGMCMQDANLVLIDGQQNMHEFFDPDLTLKKYLGNAETYTDNIPPCWRGITAEEIEAGHGGMDFLMFKDFFRAVRAGGEMPLDVYDAALWMSVTPLSEASVAAGGAPVAVPDFTRGKWLLRPIKDVTELE